MANICRNFAARFSEPAVDSTICSDVQARKRLYSVVVVACDRSIDPYDEKSLYLRSDGLHHAIFTSCLHILADGMHACMHAQVTAGFDPLDLAADGHFARECKKNKNDLRGLVLPRVCDGSSVAAVVRPWCW